MSIGACSSCSTASITTPLAPRPGADQMDADNDGDVTSNERASGEVKKAAAPAPPPPPAAPVPTRPAVFAPDTQTALLALQEFATQQVV